MSEENIIEILSEIEHDQWVAWSIDISETEVIQQWRLDRWKKLWVPYSELSEEEKEKDREWARIVLNKINYKKLCERIEKMKNCNNCKHDFGPANHCKPCYRFYHPDYLLKKPKDTKDLWELKE